MSAPVVIVRTQLELDAALDLPTLAIRLTATLGQAAGTLRIHHAAAAGRHIHVAAPVAVDVSGPDVVVDVDGTARVSDGATALARRGSHVTVEAGGRVYAAPGARVRVLAGRTVASTQAMLIVAGIASSADVVALAGTFLSTDTSARIVPPGRVAVHSAGQWRDLKWPDVQVSHADLRMLVRASL